MNHPRWKTVLLLAARASTFAVCPSSFGVPPSIIVILTDHAFCHFK